MAIFLDLALVSERWLRHKGRLARNTGRSGVVLATLALVFALVGTAGLILLSVFDTLNHSRLHRLFLLLFMLGYVLSAIFICWEYQRLGVHFRQFRVIRVSFWIKLAFVLIEGFLSLVIAFLFTFYILAFGIDLLPAAARKKQAHNNDDDNNNTELGAAGTASQAGHAADAEQPASGETGGFWSNGGHRQMLKEEGYSADGVNGFNQARQVPMSQNKPITARNF
ncbi:MAG: hypothetical protein M1816_003087 [Peltula sp. TS41687]|nr:MAG: hypothetical protein M1816_003087 [Peltula sp. TS41687]